MDVTVLAMLSVLSGAPQTEPASEKVAYACFFQYEQQSGMNKICYYDCLGSTVAINVSAVSLCPLQINQ